MEMEEYKRDACGSSLKEVAAFFDEIFPGKEKTLLRLCFPKQGLSTVCLDTKSVDFRICILDLRGDRKSLNYFCF